MRTIGVSLLAFFFVLLVTRAAFLYWDDNQTIFQYENVSLVDTNQTIQQRLVPNQNQRLVPIGAVKGTNDVDQITFYYEVIMEENHFLEVTVQGITFIKSQGKHLDIYGMIISTQEINLQSNIATVAITVSLRMPETEAELLLIQDSSLTFRVNFLQRPLD
jgi:cbb3-type cytochrome oxidase subunit 3